MNKFQSETLDSDLSAIVSALGDSWQSLRGAQILMTGGTGFIGRWMLEAIRHGNLQRGVETHVTIVTRDPVRFSILAPHLAAHSSFHFVVGDVLNPVQPKHPFTHVIHGATDASAQLNESDPRRMFDTIVTGTRNLLDVAVATNARMLFMSSGAVYGAQPCEIEHVDEDWLGGPACTVPRNAYAEGKRAAEMLCAIYGKQFGVDVITARIFALIGPLLSLDIHFAAGNFIRDAIAGKTVRVEGAGTAVRSYLYAADLTTWLLKMVMVAEPGSVYNVGSQNAVSISALAAKVARLIGKSGYEIVGQPDTGWNPGRYVPSNGRIRRDLNLSETVNLDEAILRTARWNGWNEWQSRN